MSHYEEPDEDPRLFDIFDDVQARSPERGGRRDQERRAEAGPGIIYMAVRPWRNWQTRWI